LDERLSLPKKKHNKKKKKKTKNHQTQKKKNTKKKKKKKKKKNPKKKKKKKPQKKKTQKTKTGGFPHLLQYDETGRGKNRREVRFLFLKSMPSGSHKNPGEEDSILS